MCYTRFQIDKSVIKSVLVQNELSQILRFYVNFLPELFGFVIFRYLVDAKWFKQWKKYVGYDDWDKTFVGEKDVYPGPVDNSPLLKGWYTQALRKSFFILLKNFLFCVLLK